MTCVLSSLFSQSLLPRAMMKTSLLALFACVLTAASSQAATGMFGGYIVIDTGSSTIYDLQSYGGPNNNTDFQSSTITGTGAGGNFTPGVDTLDISNASGLTFKGGTGDVTGVQLNYRVYKVGDTPGAFQTASLGFGNNAPNTDLSGNSFTGSGDQEWRGLTGDIDLLSLATAGAGTYSIEVFLRAFTNEGDRFINNTGSNYIATFSIPEPSRALLCLLGGFGFFLRRRR